MIYLIDDKKTRQELDYNWSQEKFSKYKDLIAPIYNNKDLAFYRDKMFQEGNIIIFHESFKDNYVNRGDVSAEKVRQDLIDFVQKKGDIYLILFSGSIASNSIKNKIAYSTPGNVYKNLEYNLEHQITESVLEHFLFGVNFQVEIILDIKNKIWELLYDEEEVIQLTQKLEEYVQQFNEFTGKNILLDDEVNVKYLKFMLNE